MGTAGDQRRNQGYEVFFTTHYDEVVRALALATGDRDRAEDAAQEAFARAYRKWQDVVCMERPVGWVMVVGVNQMKRWLGRADRRVSSAAARAAGDSSSHDQIDGVSEHAPLRQALDRLAPRQRATVVLRYLCDLSTEEVADAMGCSTGTVKSALHSALANLRIDLEATDASELTEPRPEVEGAALVINFTSFDDDDDEQESDAC